MEKRRLTKEMMEKMLDEVAQYSVELEIDPTLPHLGTRYLQKLTAQCRSYSNRVQSYMQEVKRFENYMRLEHKTLELDLDLQVKLLIADNDVVRKQPSIEDRRAVAISMLGEQYAKLAELQVGMIDAEENYKLLRHKHQELQRTATDVKAQRNMVKDDMIARMGGQEGYMPPQIGQDRGVPDGLPAPVAPVINPEDILDPDKKPDELPTPIDETHANMISDFLRAHPERKPLVQRPSSPPPPAEPVNSGPNAEDLLG